MAVDSAAGEPIATAIEEPAEKIYEGDKFDENRIRKSIFEGLLQSRSRYGGKKVAAIDADGRELSYNELIQAAFALGHALKAGTEKGEAVAILLPTGVGAIVSIFAVSAYGRVPAMLNFTAGEAAIKAACVASKCKRIVTAHRFIELGELQELEQALAADHEMIYLEDVRENLNIRDKIAAAVGTIAPVPN